MVGAVRRKGNVIVRVIANTDTRTLERFVRAAVSEKVSLLVTDEHSGYRNLGDTFLHALVKHAKKQYVNGAVHTQSIDSFWSLLKRGIWAASIRLAKSICRCTLLNFNSTITIG